MSTPPRGFCQSLDFAARPGRPAAKPSAGFSLVEMLIYVGILVIASALIVSVLLTTSRGYAQLSVTRAVSTSAAASLERLVRDIRGAYSIDASSVLGTNPGVLVLDSFDEDGSPYTTTYTLSNGSVMVQVTGGSATPLTASGVTASSLIFRTEANGTQSTTITVQMELEASRGKATLKKFFQTSAVVRNSYSP